MKKTSNLRVVAENPDPAKTPAAPSSLGKVGKEEWRRVMPILAANGQLNEGRRALVIQYCQAIEAAETCAAIVRKQGPIVANPGGVPKAHPAVRQHLQYSAMALRLAETLGVVSGAVKKTKAVPDGPSTSLDY